MARESLLVEVADPDRPVAPGLDRRARIGTVVPPDRGGGKVAMELLLELFHGHFVERLPSLRRAASPGPCRWGRIPPGSGRDRRTWARCWDQRDSQPSSLRSHCSATRQYPLISLHRYAETARGRCRPGAARLCGMSGQHDTACLPAGRIRPFLAAAFVRATNRTPSTLRR